VILRFATAEPQAGRAYQQRFEAAYSGEPKR